MEISPTTVYQKTERGTEELKTRANGLAPRLRQLLILFDGKRDVTEIARMLPQPEVDDQIARLVDGGFIASSATQPVRSSADSPDTPVVRGSGGSPDPRAGSAATGSPRAPAVSAPAGIGATTASAVLGAAAAVVDRLTAATALVDRLTAPTEPQPAPAPTQTRMQDAGQVQTPTRAQAQARTPAAKPTAAADDLRSLRRRITQALLDIVGPNGDDFAIRIERAASVDDVRAMVPSLLSLVEAIGGRRGVDRFLERCGPI